MHLALDCRVPSWHSLVQAYYLWWRCGAAGSITKLFALAASDPSDLARVAPALAQFAVHIGWTYSGDDFSTPYNPQAVINNYLPFANQNQTGIILMHSVYNATALALPSLIENAKMVSSTST